MTATQLELLVQQVVNRSVASTLVRYVDRAAEAIAADILKDPATKARFTALINTAIEQALANLNAPPPVELHTP
jgi:hypothetical protein